MQELARQYSPAAIVELARLALKARNETARIAAIRELLDGDVQELARQYAPAAIVELARLALQAKSETARIAAIRELFDRAYGKSRQAMEITAPAGDPLQLLFEELDALSRKPDRYLGTAKNSMDGAKG